MSAGDLAARVREYALSQGADLVGILDVRDLREHEEEISRILPSARSVIVVATRHSLAAIRSGTNEIAQFDTIHAYGECSRAAHGTSRYLESLGFLAAAVPAFIPLDMEDPKKGMRGEICWRRTAVRSGLGSYGENGLLRTREFGAAVRISGVVTTAGLEADSPLEEDACDHCMRCVEACPVGALSGGGKINKKLCGDHIFKHGFRSFRRLMEGLLEEPTEETRQVIRGHGLREMWQTFMTGNYYYCFQCQSKCAAKNLPTAAG